MLDEQSIAASLKNVVDRLREVNFEQAEAELDTLNFERLQKPIPDPSKGAGRRLFIDPGGAFGTERVNATGRYITTCRAAMKRGDQKTALDAAERALKHWQEQ
jgi:hypothetical protein